MKLFLVYILLAQCLITKVIATEQLDYQLHPEKVAEDTYVFIGKKEDFSRENGGNIVNTGFIVTKEGVIVIDTGPSFLYGQQMRQAIKEITNLPIIKVLITHHHPDHFLGNQAYSDIPIYALAETIELIKHDADSFLDNVYRMSGSWMSGTAITNILINPLKLEKEKISNHFLRYIKYEGHTDSDLAILDESTGVLFSGDLVFHNRALTTPHAKPEQWLTSLNEMMNLKFNTIVPGHGEVANNKEPIKQTYDYLSWLESTIKQAAHSGKDMNEVLLTPIPKRFSHFGVSKREFTRSVIHRFPFHEKAAFE